MTMSISPARRRSCPLSSWKTLILGFLLDEHRLDLGDHLGRYADDGMAEIFGGHAAKVGGFRNQAHAAFVFVRIEHPFPAVGLAVDFRLSVADSDQPQV